MTFYIHPYYQNIQQWCSKSEVRKQSSGRAELEEPGAADTGEQKCVIVWLHWRLLEANWCFSECVWHQRFHTECARADRCTEFWMFKPTHVKFTLSHSRSRFCRRSLYRTGEVCGDKFWPGCWQNATYVPDTSDRRLWISPTHFTKTEHKTGDCWRKR